MFDWFHNSIDILGYINFYKKDALFILMVTSREIGIPFVIGLITNIAATYFFTIQKINLTSLIFILIGSLVVIIIMSFQLKLNETKEEIEKIEIEQKKIGEKLKIHEQLIDIKAEIKEIKRRIKNG